MTTKTDETSPVALAGLVRTHIAENNMASTKEVVRESLKTITNRGWIHAGLLDAVWAVLSPPQAGSPVGQPAGVDEAKTTKTPPPNPATTSTANPGRTGASAQPSAPGGSRVIGVRTVEVKTPAADQKPKPPPPTPEEVAAAREKRRKELERREGVDLIFSTKNGTYATAGIQTFLRIESMRVKVASKTISVWTPKGWETVVTLNTDEDPRDCAILAYEILVGPWVPKKTEQKDEQREGS